VCAAKKRASVPPKPTSVSTSLLPSYSMIAGGTAYRVVASPIVATSTRHSMVTLAGRRKVAWIAGRGQGRIVGMRTAPDPLDRLLNASGGGHERSA
jgi:hypothetical protein